MKLIMAIAKERASGLEYTSDSLKNNIKLIFEIERTKDLSLTCANGS